ncbi:hypothetical protein P3T37_006262 [Kitasatospora sp. MAA4]|nr:hypothetical protein [Kitasatospora sp. MAA4]
MSVLQLQSLAASLDEDGEGVAMISTRSQNCIDAAAE